MTWAHLAGGGATSNGTTAGPVTYTMSSSVAAGSLVVVSIATVHGTIISSVTDSASNSYTLAVNSNASSSCGAIIYYSVITTGGTLSVTVSGNGNNYMTIAVDAYSFTAGTISVSSTNSANGNSTSPSAGNVTFTAPIALVYGAFGEGSATTFTPGSGFTARQAYGYVAVISYGIVTEDILNATTTPQAVNGTFGTSNSWGAAGVAFQSTGDTGSPASPGRWNGAAMLMQGA
jgi:hypothetical protein